MGGFKQKLIKRIMQLYQNDPVTDIYHKGELFRTDLFRNATIREKEFMMLESSKKRMSYEKRHPFDTYFKIPLSSHLRGKTILDLGCFTGGRTIEWALRYKPGKIVGVDVNADYVKGAQLFAAHTNVNASFALTDEKEIPFRGNSFDAILSYDVFEHVVDVKKTMDECFRILTPTGRLYAVFPSYYHPVGPHLASVTAVPCIHYFFKPDDFMGAYNQIIEERGSRAHWYRRPHAPLRDWEKGNNINGITRRQFLTLAEQCRFRKISETRRPLLSVGKISQKYPYLKIIGLFLSPASRIPPLDEFTCNRVALVFEKPLDKRIGMDA